MDWGKYQAAGARGWDFYVQGNNLNYDSSGYYQSFPSYLTSLAEFK